MLSHGEIGVKPGEDEKSMNKQMNKQMKDERKRLANVQV